MSSTELAPVNKLRVLAEKAEELRPHLQQLKVDESRFLRIVTNELQRNPNLGKCTPASFFAAVLRSAELNLEPGPLGLVWFIPRRVQGVDTVVWQLGYKGVVELAARAGISIQTGSVFEGEHFVVHGGTSPSIEHRADPNPAGDPIAWYAVATMPNGQKLQRVLGIAEVEKRRKAGKTQDKPGSAWHDWYDSMARKTVILAMKGMLPLSGEMKAAFNADDQVQYIPVTVGAPSVDVHTGELLAAAPEQSAAVEVQGPTNEPDPPSAPPDGPTSSPTQAASPPRPVSPRDKADARREQAPDGVRMATPKQLAFLVMLAEEKGWDDATRRYQAGVTSFKELTLDRASALIEDWTLKVNNWQQNRRSRLVSELARLELPIEPLLAGHGVTSVNELTAKQCQALIDEITA